MTISGGGGSGATAQANISGGAVMSITVLTPGSGYTSTPTVTVAPPAPNYTTWWSNDGTSVNGSEPSTAVSVGVSQGLFTIILGNTTLSNMTAIPASVFSSATNLQLMIWFNDGVSGFAMLNPLQSLTATPYAVFAEGANAARLSGTVPAASLAGIYGSGVSFTNPGNSFIGNGSGLTGVNATTLGGLGAGAFWKTTGNAGTTPGVNFVGTTDNEPLDLSANGQAVLRLIPDTSTNGSPDIIGGSQSNVVSSGLVGETIGGGNLNSIGPSSPIGSNPFGDLSSYSIGASYAFVGGGLLNQVQANCTFSTVGGGAVNTIDTGDIESTIAGGAANTILTNASWSTIVGGTHHTLGDVNGFIGGGWANTIGPGGGGYSVISGGDNNLIQGFANESVIAGGAYNSITGSFALPVYAVVSGGYDNSIQTNCSYCIIAGGDANTVQSGAFGSVIGGGLGNNTAASVDAVGGGESNSIASYATYSTIAGGYNNDIGAYLNGEYTANYSTVAGGSFNTVIGPCDFIGGGSNNVAQIFASFSAIGGGFNNTVNAAYATVGGGYQNTAASTDGYTTVGGGYQNVAQGSGFATVGGGYQNIASGYMGIIGGGQNNKSSGSYATVGGGIFNTASGTESTVPGGIGNTASAVGSFAAGQSATAGNSGAFVWSDGTAATSSGTSNQFVARASGGFVFYTSSTNSGVQLPAGSGSWSSLSDRTAKDHFDQVDAQSVLAGVASLPMTTWSYKTEPGVRHVGPMAQDFYAAFNVGEDNRHIAEVDEGGVALAAIKGLNEKLEEKDKEIQQLQQNLAQLQAMVSELARKRSK